jgi:hypothetical protein
MKTRKVSKTRGHGVRYVSDGKNYIKTSGAKRRKRHIAKSLRKNRPNNYNPLSD